MSKKQINVFIQYPIKVSDSQYYRTMIDFHPVGINYVNTQETGIIINQKKFDKFKKFKKLIREFLNIVPLPIINIHYTKGNNFNVIHCAHCLSKNKSPWVADIESIYQMWGGVKGTTWRKNRARKIIMSKYCKKIITWTKYTKNEILKEFPEVKNKIEVVGYAMPEIKFRKKKKSKNITLFFSGRHFYGKGGVHAVEVMDRLTKKYPNIKGILNGAIPENIISKYSKNKKLKFYPLMSHQDLFKLYQDADIFVYPGYSDTYGFVYMEAMAFGVPIVTVDGKSRREIIKEGLSGFVIDRPKKLDAFSLDGQEDIIKKIMRKTELLINDLKLREKMSKDCIKEIKSGKFSLKKRNIQLRKIYEEAILNEKKI